MMDVTSRTCKVCHYDPNSDPLVEPPLTTPHFSHIRNKWIDFQITSQNGCPICQIIMNGVSAIDSRYANDRHTVLRLWWHSPFPLIVELRHRTMGSRNVEFFFPEELMVGDSYFGSTRAMLENLSHKAAADIGLRMLQRCRDQHPSCQASDPSIGPKRLLDIGTEKEPQIRLRIVDNITDPYVALSYCWGNPACNLTTTIATLSARRRGIDWVDIPQTIKDAILITRFMHIRYIWVDALCIVQDHSDDWNEEAAKMVSVYENAIVVISATRSASSSDGFIGSAVRHQWKGFLQHPSRGEVPVYARASLLHDALKGSVVRPLKNPLLLRGWTLQERLLARRTLHFLDTELVWECLDGFWCECSGNNKEMYSYFSRAITSRDSIQLAMWQVLVYDYSRRKLTKVEDTYPALSGVITKFKSRGLGEFLAGLWTNDFGCQLLWYAVSEKVPPNPDRNIGPTWSWTSSPYPIGWFFYHAPDLRYHCSVVRFSGIWADASEQSCDNKTRVEIRGPMINATVICDVRDNPQTLSKTRVDKIKLGDAYWKEDDDISFLPDIFAHSATSRKCLGHGQTVSCMLLLQRKISYGLLVVVPSQTVAGAYERVGVAEIGDDTYEWFEGVDSNQIVLV